MKRPYKVMVLQDNDMVKMYRTEDVSMYRAISAIEQIHSLQYPKDQFRITYIEEIIE